MEQSAISCMAERKTINFGIRKKKEIGCKFIFGTILYKRKQYHLAGSLFQEIRRGCESTRWTAYPETDVQFLTFFTVDSGVLRCP